MGVNLTSTPLHNRAVLGNSCRVLGRFERWMIAIEKA
jgi:hypothetical protein